MTGHLKHLSQPLRIKERIYHICPFSTIYSALPCSITAVAFRIKALGPIYHEYTQRLSVPETVNSIKDV